jgi:alpha-mannosidase
MKKKTFHLIPNAHLDPVWLWNWQEGLNEGIRTSRTVLNLMDEFPELTFCRGEISIYRHIEKYDPETFARIKEYIKSGRWEIIGATEVQSDNNLPATETFSRHYANGLSYLAEKFQFRPRVAWAADSFGHTAGLPEIIAAAGMTGFLFTRPAPRNLPLSKPAFWWEGAGGARILCYRPEFGWYGTERVEATDRLNETLEAASRLDLENIAVFIGLGNHGGGPTRQQLFDIHKWAEEHPEVNVKFSGMQKLLDAIRKEVKQKGDAFLPTFKGELNYCLRGCYASVARFKFPYRRAENALLASERSITAIKTALEQKDIDKENIKEAWNTLLFNTFHDILPGTSIERATDEQISSIGGTYHRAQILETDMLNALAMAVDTTVPKPKGDDPETVPFLLWNPHPWPYKGYMELEASLDYRPVQMRDSWKGKFPVQVRDSNHRAVPFQKIQTECLLYNLGTIWRKRVVVNVNIPPMGWSVYTMGLEDGAVKRTVPNEVKTKGENTISNDKFTIKAVVGENGIQIREGRKQLIKGTGLTAIVVKDPWGSWGGPEQVETKGLDEIIETWKIVSSDILEAGTETAMLQVRLAGKNSWIDLIFSLTRGGNHISVKGRLLINEKEARVKLVFPVNGVEGEFDVPGTIVRRKPSGEVPGGRWVRMFNNKQEPVLGFASDALYCFENTKKGELRATVARVSRYAYAPSVKDGSGPPTDAAVDCGELKFNFIINNGNNELEKLSQIIGQPPVAWITPVSKGTLPRSGSFVSLSPASVEIQALKPANDGNGLILRLRETKGRSVKPKFKWLDSTVDLGRIRANTIATWRLVQSGGKWTAKETNIAEE